jgi:hypothetical protein
MIVLSIKILRPKPIKYNPKQLTNMKKAVSLLSIIGFSILTFTSCQDKTKMTDNQGKDNSELQEKLLHYTRDFNNMAKKDSSDANKLDKIKLEYKTIVDSIKTCYNWKGKLTMLDLDEVEAFSSDTVVMRISIDNIYDSGN